MAWANDDWLIDAGQRKSGGDASRAEIGVAHGMPCRWEIEVSNTRAQHFYSTLGVEIRDKKVARWSLIAMRTALAKLQRTGQ